jgi:hypothetical protein
MMMKKMMKKRAREEENHHRKRRKIVNLEGIIYSYFVQNGYSKSAKAFCKETNQERLLSHPTTNSGTPTSSRNSFHAPKVTSSIL